VARTLDSGVAQLGHDREHVGDAPLRSIVLHGQLGSRAVERRGVDALLAERRDDLRATVVAVDALQRDDGGGRRVRYGGRLCGWLTTERTTDRTRVEMVPGWLILFGSSRSSCAARRPLPDGVGRGTTFTGRARQSRD
jgi:hypothetical protein